MRIEYRDPREIRPYHHNPRTQDQAVEAVAASIAKYGFRQPIVTDAEGVIIVGHARHAAALRLDLDTVPVHVAADLTRSQVRAYRLADNATRDLAEWDNEALIAEILALDPDGEAIPGFTSEDIDALLAAGEEPDYDEWDVALDGLSDGEPQARRATFTLTPAQRALVQATAERAQPHVPKGHGEPNADAAALVHIARCYLGEA